MLSIYISVECINTSDDISILLQLESNIDGVEFPPDIAEFYYGSVSVVGTKVLRVIIFTI